MVQRVWTKPEPDEAVVAEYYGLDPQEWTGSITDRVERILDKNGPNKERYANALLRDECISLAQGVEYCCAFEQGSMEASQLILDDSLDLRSAIMKTVWGGVLLEDGTQSAIERVDQAHDLAIQNAKWHGHNLETQDALGQAHESFTETRENARRLNETRRYYRSVNEGLRQSTGSNREPVLLGDVLREQMRSMGRDDLGQSSLSQVQSSGRGGVFAASLPGSQVSLGRTPGAQRQTSVRTAFNVSVQEQSQSMNIDDGFEF